MVQSIFNIPNGLSFLRIVLTPVFLYFAINHQESLAFFFLFIAGITDWADGYAARCLHQTSEFGQILDPVADKILLVSSYVGFYMLGLVSLPLMSIVVGRDLFLVLMSLFILQKKLNVPINPSYISKMNTVFQIIHIGIILLNSPAFVTRITAIIVMISTLCSGLAYAYRFYAWYTQKQA